MISQNIVTLTGKVVRPSPRRYRPDGSPVIQFSFELSDPGERNLITIVAIGKMAEMESSLFQSGQPLLVEGHLKRRQWQSPEGKHCARVEVIATDIQRLEDSQLNPVLHKRGEDHEKTF
jgi:single-stranded DNA-binding protein